MGNWFHSSHRNTIRILILKIAGIGVHFMIIVQCWLKFQVLKANYNDYQIIHIVKYDKDNQID